VEQRQRRAEGARADERMSVSSMGTTTTVQGDVENSKAIAYFDLTREQLRFVFFTLLQEKALERQKRQQGDDKREPNGHGLKKQESLLELSSPENPEAPTTVDESVGAETNGTKAAAAGGLQQDTQPEARLDEGVRGVDVEPLIALDHAGFREALARSRIVFKDDEEFKQLALRVDGNGDGHITFR
jgi:hypothetical protein